MDGGHVRKRLDRCLAHVDWRIAFPHAIVEILAPHNFDHNLLLLMSCSKFKSNSVRSFQFLAHPDFNELISECGQGLMGMLFQSWPRYKSNMMILIKKKSVW